MEQKEIISFGKCPIFSERLKFETKKRCGLGKKVKVGGDNLFDPTS